MYTYITYVIHVHIILSLVYITIYVTEATVQLKWRESRFLSLEGKKALFFRIVAFCLCVYIFLFTVIKAKVPNIKTL